MPFAYGRPAHARHILADRSYSRPRRKCDSVQSGRQPIGFWERFSTPLFPAQFVLRVQRDQPRFTLALILSFVFTSAFFFVFASVGPLLLGPVAFIAACTIGFINDAIIELPAIGFS
jgi:hypothetical protein